MMTNRETTTHSAKTENLAFFQHSTLISELSYTRDLCRKVSMWSQGMTEIHHYHAPAAPLFVLKRRAARGICTPGNTLIM